MALKKCGLFHIRSAVSLTMTAAAAAAARERTGGTRRSGGRIGEAGRGRRKTLVE
jgi:hypothetical protein